MTIRLNRATGDLNVGVATVVEFLQRKGYIVKADPSTRVTKEQYAVLVKEFSMDKNLRLESKRFIQERQDKDRSKASISIDGYDKKEPEKTTADDVIKTVIPEDVRPKLKPVRKIDLSKLNQRTEKKPVKEGPGPQPVVATEKKKVAEEVKSVVNEVKKEKVATTPVTSESKPVEKEPKPVVVEKPAETEKKVVEEVEKEEPEVVISPEKTKEKEERPVAEAPATPVEKEEEDVFKIRSIEFISKINVIGQIDLVALNQSTHPKKKSKEEKRKKREEREKLRQDQKKQMKEAIVEEVRKEDNKQAKVTGKRNLDPNGRKKRNHINNSKKKVDANSVASNFAYPTPSSERANNNRGGNQQGGSGQNRNCNNNNRDRLKKPIVKQEVSEEDVARQVKEALARLASKDKNRGAKYRKEKRDLIPNRVQRLEDQEMIEGRVSKLTEFVTVNELADMMNVSVNQVIGTYTSMGMVVSISQRLDAEIIDLVAKEFGFKTEYVNAEVAQAIVEEEDAPEDLEHRAPIVTIMGHVDHGKTPLSDCIRKANVTTGETGGITQHIGAYHVTLEGGRKITLLDTPGHEMFAAIRARGAKVTDIAIIIVAAGDDIMPQTKEAVNHAAAADVPIVSIINKVDKSYANPEKIKKTLAQMNCLVGEWGDKYQSQDISAKKGLGVPELMEKVLLKAEMLDLKANPNHNAAGSIIESTLDEGRGYVAAVLVSDDTLKVDDIVLAETSYSRVKVMFNERNQRVTQTGPSEPVLILGLNRAPAADDASHMIKTDQETRGIANKREQLQRERGLRAQKLSTLDEVGRCTALGNFQELNVVMKGDVDDSIEALSNSLIKLSTERVQINVIHKAVGQISESDVALAATSDAIIIGFQVRPSASARKFTEQEGVNIRLYSIIYAAIEEVRAAMEGMLAPEAGEMATATIEVREVFHITKIGTAAGAVVEEGKVRRSNKARLIRDGIIIFSGSISALKRFKDDIKEVGTSFERSVNLVDYDDLKIRDMTEAYEEVEVRQTLQFSRN